MLITRHNMPRWLIFTIDMAIVCLSVVLAYLLRFNFSIPDHELRHLPVAIVVVAFVRMISFFIAKTYAGIIRYTSTEDAIRIFVVIMAGSAVFSITNLFTYYLGSGRHVIPFSIIIIEFITVIFAMVTYRVVVKIAYLELINPSSVKSKVIIYGAGEAGIITKRTLDRDAGSKNKVIAFIDDNLSKQGKKIEGVPIHGINKLTSLLKEEDIDHVIIAIQTLSQEKKQEVTDICLEANVKTLTVPPVVNWINGELSYRQIRQIRIEDLLERETIELDREKMRHELQGKRVMITGAGGSIGSELARQVMAFHPKILILSDQAESSLFDLEIEFAEKFSHDRFRIIVADIRNVSRMEHIFRLHEPQIIFHAAAYKHVPMMENNPAEAILTNIRGTKNVADLASQYKAGKFIMVSTDKAVNPTNVMGASKRIAEIYIQALNDTSDTKYITTRFGNVLGSNGSAIPLFRKQIEKGGPITVTHPEVTRFFMTIPEACQLVLEAGAMGNGGEIYLFDMGKPVKIKNLATKMIRLAGLEPGKDIQIKYIGLRPGEKLYEELLSDGENSLPTHHPRIMIGKVRKYAYDSIVEEIESLLELIESMDERAIVKKMKSIVPEFISKNSVFEELDEGGRRR